MKHLATWGVDRKLYVQITKLILFSLTRFISESWSKHTCTLFRMFPRVWKMSNKPVWPHARKLSGEISVKFYSQRGYKINIIQGGNLTLTLKFKCIHTKFPVPPWIIVPTMLLCVCLWIRVARSTKYYEFFLFSVPIPSLWHRVCYIRDDQ